MSQYLFGWRLSVTETSFTASMSNVRLKDKHAHLFGITGILCVDMVLAQSGEAINLQL